MKFVVFREPYGNIVDVRLHRESKEKIQKIFFFGLFAVGSVVAARRYTNNITVDEIE